MHLRPLEPHKSSRALTPFYSTWAPIRSMNSTISSARQTVVRGPSFTGLGKRPVLQPSHQALLLMGTSCRTWGSRRKPICGMVVIVVIITPPDRSLIFVGSVSRLFGRAVLRAEKSGLESYWMALHCTVWTNFLLTGFRKSLRSLLLILNRLQILTTIKEAAHRSKAMRRLVVTPS